MRHVKRTIFCVSVVAVLLLSIAGTAIAVSPAQQKGKAADKVQKALSVNGAVDVQSRAVEMPIRVVHSGHGFALKGDEFHVLRVNILGAMRIQPTYVRELMEKRMSIEDIRAELGKGSPYYRGYMRLGESYYRLVNMSVVETEGTRVFEADVVGPVGSVEASMNIVGYINITVMRYEGVRIGDGELTMTEGDYCGEYRVLLDVLPLRSQ